MHPLRHRPSKLFSKVVIAVIWVAGLAFALPMGLVHTFGYVPDNNFGAVGGDLKPFCYIDFGPNVTNATLVAFKSYRRVPPHSNPLRLSLPLSSRRRE